jgi:uncharacterized protein
MALQVTTFTAAVLGLLLFVLSYAVVKVRQRASIAMGDGGNPALVEKMRAQANLTEYAPMLLILMGLIEYQTGYSVILGVIGVALITGRIAHAIGMAKPAPNAYRVAGTATTWILLVVLSGWALLLSV